MPPREMIAISVVPPADIDDHVRRWLVDGQIDANRRCHCLFNEDDLLSPCAHRRVFDSTFFNARDARGHRDQDFWGGKGSVRVRLFWMRAFKRPSVISKSAITPSFIGRTASILRGVLPSIVFALWPISRIAPVCASTATTEGLGQNNALALDVDEGIGRAEVDTDIVGKRGQRAGRTFRSPGGRVCCRVFLARVTK